MILYKYTNANIGFDILDELKIRYTQLNALNDPFESYPPISDVFSDEQLKNMIRMMISNKQFVNNAFNQGLNSLYHRLPVELQQQISLEPFSSLMTYLFIQDNNLKGKSFYESIMENVYQNQKKIISEAKNLMPHNVASNLAVLSLTDVPNNEIMWSHYADSHYGLLIGFDSEHPSFENNFKVKYFSQERRPKILVPDENLNESQKKEIVTSIFGVKNNSWEYENEYRILAPINTLIDSEKKDSKGNLIYKKNLYPEAISCIVYGHLMKKEMRQKIENMLLAKLLHVKAFTQKADVLTHKIEIIEDHNMV
jgi:hypothetical protein